MSYIVNRIKGIFYSKLGENLKLRSVVQNLAAFFVRNRDLKGNSKYFKIDDVNKHYKELNERGITYLGKILDDDTIEEVKEYISSLKCHDTWAPELGEFQLDEVSNKTHTASFKREDLVLNQTILDIANNKGVLEIAKKYLGATPTISNVNAWWSFGHRKKAQEAQNFHRDNDDIKFCKLFVYLTDVNKESGPHVYVENTVKSDKLRKVRRYEDDEVEAAFGEENIKTLIYPKGHAFIEDTYGMHKGQLPISENRLLFQVQFSISPIGYIKYEPEVINFKGEYNNYVNRLLIKSK